MVAGTFTAPMSTVAKHICCFSRLDVPRRREAETKTKRKRAPAGTHDAAAVLSHRERLVAEIASIRKLGHGTEFSEKAERLLTRWWGRANWDGRRKLIETAEWLVRLECNRGAHPARG
jgi:hypothetical protein